MNFADFIQTQDPTLVHLKNGISYRVGEFTFQHFVWDDSTVLFSKRSDPPPLESLCGRSVVACSIPAGPGRPNAWIFLDPDQPYWNFDFGDQNLILKMRTLEKCEGHEHDRLYPQYKRSSKK